MTREAILQEINQLPDDVLIAFLNLIKVSGLLEQIDSQKTEMGPGTHKYRTAGALKGKIILHEDIDEQLEDMKEYMY